MQFPSYGQITAFGRHVVSFSMGGIAFLTIAHIVTAGQAGDATNAINQISSGVASIIAGVTTLVSIGSGVWAAVSASLKSQVAAVQASPVVQVITSDPKLAAAVPGVKVGQVPNG